LKLAWTLCGVACASGGGATDDAGPSVPQPPTVSLPGLTVVATGAVIQLEAVASDPDGEAVSYQWTQTSGTTVNVSGAATSMLTFTAPNARTNLSFRVTVRDSGGASTQATAEISVRRVTNSSPLPLLVGRLFTYAVREEVYTWQVGTLPLSAGNPAWTGTVQLAVDSKETFNGLDVWTVRVTDETTASGSMCNAAAAPATACPSPNEACSSVSGTCQSNKPMAQTVQLLQADEQLLKWVDAQTEPLWVVDPTRPVADPTQPLLLEGYEFFLADTRVDVHAPRTPLRFVGESQIQIPGMVVANARVASGDTAYLVEIFDGVRRTDLLAAYHTTRTYYAPGTGLVFFQGEDVPDGYAASAVVGYRDAVLTGIEPDIE
jgi:hypothetical protein